MYDKQAIVDYIKEKAYKIYIDKVSIQEKFNCSVKTSERVLKSIHYKHMKQHCIDMMKDIEEGVPSPELVLKYKCTLSNLNAFIRRHNLTKVYDHRLKNYSDLHYFNQIDTPEKAYILGFIGADGHVSHKVIRITLHSRDKDILQKIIKEVGLKNKTVKDNLVKTSFSQKISSYSTLQFGTKEMLKDLHNLGFDNRKTTSFAFPKISEKFYLDFIRGYCDGDGSFTKDINNRYSFSLEGTEKFLLFVKNFLEKNYSIKFNSTLYKRHPTANCCYTLRASGKKNVIRLLNLLYKNSSLYLDRKYNKYLEITKM